MATFSRFSDVSRKIFKSDSRSLPSTESDSKSDSSTLAHCQTGLIKYDLMATVKKYFLFLLGNTTKKVKENVSFIYIKMKVLFAHAVIISTARASSIVSIKLNNTALCIKHVF